MAILEGLGNVHFGPIADMCSAKRHVRFTPESRNERCKAKCPIRAKSGRRDQIRAVDRVAHLLTRADFARPRGVRLPPCRKIKFAAYSHLQSTRVKHYGELT